MPRPTSRDPLPSRAGSEWAGARFGLGVLAIVILGAALRWHGIGRESLWFDEAYSIDLAARSVSQILSERWIDIHPPLYYLALRAWMSVAGGSEAGTRLLSLIFDLGTIGAAAILAARVAGRGTAIVTAILIAASPFHVEYSQESRMYALLGLTSTLSMLTFVAMLERPTRLAQAAYISMTTAMLYTHAYSAFVLGAQFATCLLAWPALGWSAGRIWRAWTAAAVVVLALYAPWVATLIDQVVRVQSAFWIDRPDWGAIVDPFRAFAGSGSLLWVAVPLAAIGAWRTTRGPRLAGVPPTLMLLPWLAMPILVPLALSRISAPIFLPKYTIAASVPFAILAASGLVALPGRTLRMAVLTIIAALLLPAFQTYYAKPRKDDWRSAAARLEGQARPGDLVVFYPWYNQVPFDYYHRREDLVRRPLIPDIQIVIPPSEDVPELVARVRDSPRLWFVVLQGTPTRERIVDEFSRTMELERHSVSGHVELFLFAAESRERVKTE